MKGSFFPAASGGERAFCVIESSQIIKFDKALETFIRLIISLFCSVERFLCILIIVANLFPANINLSLEAKLKQRELVRFQRL